MTTEFSTRSNQENYAPVEEQPTELQQLRYRVIHIARDRPEEMKAETQHHVRQFLEGNMTQENAMDFMADTWGNERLQEKDRIALHQLNQHPKLSDVQMDQYIQLLGKANFAAVQALTYSPGTIPEQGFKIEQALNQACAHAVMEKSLDYPLPSILSESPDTSMSFNEIARLRLDGISHETSSLDLFEKAIYRSHKQASEYSKNGHPPHWFDPETMTVTTENWQKGYNPVNNGSIDPNASLEELAAKIQHRMNLLEQNDPHEPGISHLELTRMVLRPMLHQEFVRHLDQHDPPGANYSPDAGDGGLPNDWNKGPYTGPTNSPFTHAAASYGHNLTERMALTGLGNTTRSTPLAWQIQYNLPYLNNLGDWANQAIGHNQAEPVTGALEPPMNWNTKPAVLWDRIAELTQTGTGPQPLYDLTRDYQERALQALTRFDSVQDYSGQTRYMNLQDLREPHLHDQPEHPHNALLREAMTSLDDARHCLGRIDTLLTQEPPGEETHTSKYAFHISETQALSKQATEAVQTMDPQTAAEMMANTGSAAVIGYYDRAIRHLTHADFVISNVRFEQQQTDAVQPA